MKNTETTMKKMNVPYAKTVHGQEEIDAVVDCLKTSTQMGKNVRKMEEQVSRLYDKNYGVMVNSGSSANYLATELVDLPKGAEVITPVLTFSTTIAPLIKSALIPSFIDIALGTYNIDVDQVESMITPNTKAMMIPNLLGNLPNWRTLRQLADKYNLITIEDSCDTIGCEIDGKSSGRFADISTTSFYGSHIINCAGNGGMLCVNNKDWSDRARLLRSWGRSSSLFVESEAVENRFNIEIEGIQYDKKFVFEALGYNLEPSEISAAFGLVQLSKLQKNIDLRNKWFNQQLSFFSKYEEWFILPKVLENSRTAFLAFPITVRDSAPFSRTEMQIFLEKRGIQTRTIFTGNILRQPGFKDIPHKAMKKGYPNADEVMRGGILLACHHGLTQEMMDYVHECVTTFFYQYQ